jgi:sec-independent protein translocase protein TatB
MSLPDTVFIFVLALIIFGPKKLPEIGRQLGRLVGEFRRASNEFKFQIEEELRQVDFNEKRSNPQTIAASVPETEQIGETLEAPTYPEEATDSAFPEETSAYREETPDPAENIPVGQHPNIDTFDSSELSSPEEHSFRFDHADSEIAGEEISTGLSEPEPTPILTPAAGTQARTAVPYAAPEPESNDVPQSPEFPAPVNSHTAPTEAEITHG